MLLPEIEDGLESYNTHPSGDAAPSLADAVHKVVQELRCVSVVQLWHILRGRRFQTPPTYEKFRREVDNVIVRGNGMYAYIPKAQGQWRGDGTYPRRNPPVILSDTKWNPDLTSRFSARLTESDVYASFAYYRDRDRDFDIEVGPAQSWPKIQTTQGRTFVWPGIGFKPRGLYPRPDLSYPLFVWAMPPKQPPPESLAYLFDSLEMPAIEGLPEHQPRWSVLVVGSSTEDLIGLAEMLSAAAAELTKTRGWYVPFDLYVRHEMWVGSTGALNNPFGGWTKPSTDPKTLGANPAALLFDPVRLKSPVSAIGD